MKILKYVTLFCLFLFIIYLFIQFIYPGTKYWIYPRVATKMNNSFSVEKFNSVIIGESRVNATIKIGNPLYYYFDTITSRGSSIRFYDSTNHTIYVDSFDSWKLKNPLLEYNAEYTWQDTFLGTQPAWEYFSISYDSLDRVKKKTSVWQYPY